MAQGHAGLFTSGCYVALTEEQIQGPITLHFIYLFIFCFNSIPGGETHWTPRLHLH